MNWYRTYQKLACRKRVRDGLLFIPDISGFTELVRSTDLETGRAITHALLSAILNKNRIGLRLAEIEGDAILFYRYGKAPSTSDLMQQYKQMLAAFEDMRSSLEMQYQITLPVSLKVVAHYGPLAEYWIGHFRKLYGEAVIEAHRLLKNSIGCDSYLLMTEVLSAHAARKQSTVDLLRETTHTLCEVYGSLRKICFTYYPSDVPGSVLRVA